MYDEDAIIGGRHSIGLYSAPLSDEYLTLQARSPVITPRPYLENGYQGESQFPLVAGELLLMTGPQFKRYIVCNDSNTCHSRAAIIGVFLVHVLDLGNR